MLYLKNNREEIATLELINKHFWKSRTGPLSALTLPFFLMLIYRILGQDDITLFTSGLAAYFSFSILPLCFISLPQMIVEFKTSIISRKISISKITKSKFSLIILSYNFIAIFAATLIITLLYAIFLGSEAPKVFENIKWPELIYSLFNIYISCLSFGLLIGVLINKIILIQIIAFLLIIISITFSGQFIPVNVLARSLAIKIFTLFSPTSYSLNMMNMVLENDNKQLIDLCWNISHSSVPIPGLAPNSVQFINGTDVFYQENIENYHFSGIFDLNHTYKMFSIKYYSAKDNASLLLNSRMDISMLPVDELPIVITELKSTDVYSPWQLILNIIMPYVLTFTFFIVAIKKFNWTSR